GYGRSQSAPLLARSDIPEPHRPVRTGRDEAKPLALERHGLHVRPVAVQPPQFFSLNEIPQVDRAAPAPGQPAAIAREIEEGLHCFLATELGQRGPTREPPKTERLVGIAGEEGSAIGSERQGSFLRRLVWNSAD